MDGTSDKGCKVAKVKVSGETTTQKPEGLMIPFRLSKDDAEALQCAVAASGLNRSAYIRARIFGSGVRDNSLLRIADSLHVAGIGLRDVARSTDLGWAADSDAKALLTKVRQLLDQLAARL